LLKLQQNTSLVGVFFWLTINQFGYIIASLIDKELKMTVQELITLLQTMQPTAVVSFATEMREIVVQPEMVTQEIYGTQSFVTIAE
jgi:hypothetical protein